MLQIKLLGSPEIRRDGVVLNEITSRKALALLFFLVTTERHHFRDKLAGLFWYDMPDIQARKNLRNLIPCLRLSFSSYITINRHTLGIDPSAPIWCDVQRFQQALEGHGQAIALAQLEEVLALYQGEFLQGFYVADAPVFEEWMLSQRNHLARLMTQGLEGWAERAFAEGHYQQGLQATERLLQFEPWNEKAHQLQMLLLAARGERERALLQFDWCAHELRKEFQFEPDAKTHDIYMHIKNGLFHDVRHEVHATAMSIFNRIMPSQAPSTVALLPRAWTTASEQPLYGREGELGQLEQWLLRDRCRLITLSGRMGSGKTALIQALGQRMQRGATWGQPWCVLSQSVRMVTDLNEIYAHWLQHLVPGCHVLHAAEYPVLLLQQLRQQPCLLVLDDLDWLLHSAAHKPQQRELWGLIEMLLSHEHQSCLVLIGRSIPPFNAYFAFTSPLVRHLPLTGLSYAAAYDLLQGYQLKGSLIHQRQLIEQHDALPLFLHLAAREFATTYGGYLDCYEQPDLPLLEVVGSVLDVEFANLGQTGRLVMHLLAAVPQALTLTQITQALHAKGTCCDLWPVIQQLVQAALIISLDGTFTLSSMVRSYVRLRLVEAPSVPQLLGGPGLAREAEEA
ncbi:MAG: NACHT domain-containing protein [Candidatus Viridilinea halotolerans]|uniref:NACHT domain-containing protein n=1 Tax=Candidatus Viridilinea halotolerans TaxID=2491704 RepID=A0A426U3G1_9CHLR|nr:MAG: NACHT domain-containing protein [Candidatus Viridilinea halotolerans]